MTARYAVSDEAFGGRTYNEAPETTYTPFELDRLRVVSCTAFRRLEGKTQVFAPHVHDHFRTRMTHTVEVSQIARTLARLLGANETLAEVIALAHDLGHPPFGHAGEAALDEMMTECGGFNHNAHSLRVVEYLEHPFPPFRGLNLTGETRAGLASHCTRYDVPRDIGAAPSEPNDGAGLVDPTDPGPPRRLKPAAQESSRVTHGSLVWDASVEAQIASLADRIAYNCHDLEDAIGAELISIDDLNNVALWRDAYERTAGFHRKGAIHAIRRVVLDDMLRSLLEDAVGYSAVRLADVPTPKAAKAATDPLVAFSDQLEAPLHALEQFLLERIYRHEAVVAADADGKRMIRELFAAFLAGPNRLPPRFAARLDDQGPHRVVGDYIAGMTDRFCQREHARLR